MSQSSGATSHPSRAGDSIHKRVLVSAPPQSLEYDKVISKFTDSDLHGHLIRCCVVCGNLECDEVAITVAGATSNLDWLNDQSEFVPKVDLPCNACPYFLLSTSGPKFKLNTD